MIGFPSVRAEIHPRPVLRGDTQQDQHDIRLVDSVPKSESKGRVEARDVRIAFPYPVQQIGVLPDVVRLGASRANSPSRF